MALTQPSGFTYQMFVTLVDAGGDQSTLKYALLSADEATADTDAATILSRLANVTNAKVKGYTIGRVWAEDALTLPTDGQVEERAAVSCEHNNNPLKRTTVMIPAPVDAIFVGAPGTTQYNVVDIVDAALALYIDIWEATGAIASISDGEQLTDGSIREGRRTHRKSSKG